MNAVDTNILVYAVDTSEPVKSRLALDLLSNLPTLAPLIVPWQVAAEFLTCLRRWESTGKIARQQTEDYLNRFVLQLPVVFPTTQSLAIALNLSDKFSLSHWDSMLLAACVEADITTLYSEDLTHGAFYNTVRVVNPFL